MVYSPRGSHSRIVLNTALRAGTADRSKLACRRKPLGQPAPFSGKRGAGRPEDLLSGVLGWKCISKGRAPTKPLPDSAPAPAPWRGCSPADSVQQAQRGVRGTHVDAVLQDELVDPLNALLAAPGHEGGDPQDAAVETVQPLQQLLPPRGVDQVLKGPLDDGGVHGHQVGLEPHIPRVLLHGGQVAPTGEKGVMVLWGKMRRRCIQFISSNLYLLSPPPHRPAPPPCLLSSLLLLPRHARLLGSYHT